MKAKEIIDQARRAFDYELHTDKYKRIHADDEHLDALMKMIEIQPGKKYMDLGTGNGYLAFEMAQRFPNIQIMGVDIAIESIRQNQKLQREREIVGLKFDGYDGLSFPIDDKSYHGIISRYAFHHFPDPEKSIQEMVRILDEQGFVIISDPQTYDEDRHDFVDQFQNLKKDGHVHFYRQAELDELFFQAGFVKETQFRSMCTYPRDLTARYQQLLETTTKTILDKYQVRVTENMVYITVAVINARYRKK